MKYPPPSSSRKGLTLIELLLALAISSFMFIIIMNSFINFFRNRQTSVTIASLQKTYSQIITDITNNTRWAALVKVTTTPPLIVAYLPETSDTISYLYSDSLTLNKISHIGATSTTTNLLPANVEITNYQLSVPSDNPSPLRYFNITIELTSTINPQQKYTGNSTISVRLNQIGEP